MSVHNWKNHWQAWLLDGDFIPVTRLDDLVGPYVDWALLDVCQFAADMRVSSQNYALLDMSEDNDQYILFRRFDGYHEFAQVFKIETLDTKWAPIDGKITKAVNMGGRGGCCWFLDQPIIQPDPSADADVTEQAWSGHVDDVIKQFIRYNAVVGTAYNDPDGEPRGIAGLTVAADKSEHATILDSYSRKGQLWEIVRTLCEEYGVDIAITPTWNGAKSAVTFEVETYYPERGQDRTPGNSGPVVLADTYRVFTESSKHFSKFTHRTHFYTANGHTVLATNGSDTHKVRAEIYVGTMNPERLPESAVDHRAEQGHTFGFRETTGIQLGRDFSLGDTIPHFDNELGTLIYSEELSGWRITIQQDALGSEQIELRFGDEKPRNTSGGGPMEDELDGESDQWFLKGDAAAKVGPDSDNAVQIYSTTGGSTFTEEAANNRIAFRDPWTEEDIDSVGELNGLHTTTTGAPVVIGADTTPHVASWITSPYGGTLATKLEVIGQIAVDRYVYSPTMSLVAGGYDDSYFKLHVGDAATPDGWLDVNDSDGNAVFRCVGDNDIASWFKCDLQVLTSHSLIVASDTGATQTFVVAGATGNTTWGNGATLTFNEKAYTPPTGWPAASGYHLASTDAGVLSWAAPAIGAIGNGSAQWQVPVTGASPFTPAWTALSASPGAAQKPLMTDSSGYLTLVRLQVADADSYIANATNDALYLNGETGLLLQVGGTTVAYVDANYLRPGTTGVTELGASTKTWQKVWAEDGDFADDVWVDDVLTVGNYIQVSGDVLFYGDGASNRSLSGHTHGDRTGNWQTYGSGSWATVYQSQSTGSTVVGYYITLPHYHPIGTPYGAPAI